jgi:hypothetical protein
MGAGASAALFVLDVVRIKMPPRTVPGCALGERGPRSTLFTCTTLVVFGLWPKSVGAGAAWLSTGAIATHPDGRVRER